MVRLCHIDSFDLPELLPYQTMRWQQKHRDQGVFVAEGEKVVRRLLASSLEVISVLLPEKWYDTLRETLETRPEIVRVFVAEKKLLETLTGFSMYQGLLALARVPTAPAWETVLRRKNQPLLLGIAEGLSSAENVGALIRNAAAFRANAIAVSETCASPFLRRAVRSSMGAVFEMPVFESRDIVADLELLRRNKVRLIAAHPHVSGRRTSQADFCGDCAVVFGSEGYGISPRVLQQCDDAVAIPMPPTVDSLNVGSAAAAFFYEANRQRGYM